MAILVTYSSKHGATQSVAERIAGVLRQSGREVDLRPVNDVAHLKDYEAVVLGSAVYFGAWMKDAVAFARRYQTDLTRVPVYLFSVGPLGDDKDKTQPDPKEIAELRETIHPRDHHTFFGVLDRAQLSFAERLVASAVKAPEGDFRNWDEIAAWAGRIAVQLAPTGAAPQG